MKKVTCAMLAAVFLLLGSTLPGYAWDGRRGHGVRSRVVVDTHIFIGPGFWWGPRFWWGPPYPYYVAPPVIVQQEPPAYIQPQPQSQYYWYYCPDPQGYYPYVQQCPTGWMTVVPPAAPPGK